LYILVEGKLIIYSLTEAKGKYTIPVNKSLDTLKISEANGSVVLLSTAENLIEIRIQPGSTATSPPSPQHASHRSG
jgi:hypothetical protein